MKTDQWELFHGDCIPHMHEDMEANSIDFAVTSVPFPSLFAYTSDPADIGNTDTVGAESKIHLSFFYKGLARVLKPGRVLVVHVCQVVRMKRNGGVGLCDFRGLNIRIGERAGLIYEYDWLVRKNPQAQAIRNRSRELQFAGLENDRAASRGTICDYLIKFRAPGENSKKIEAEGQVTRNNWIDWAEGAWFDIRETDTLNTKMAKGEDDTKHICPLQLEVINRLIRLYSDPGELVMDPFNGIASTGVEALKLGRRYKGCELKDEYFSQSIKNLSGVVKEKTSSKSLFSEEESGVVNVA